MVARERIQCAASTLLGWHGNIRAESARVAADTCCDLPECRAVLHGVWEGLGERPSRDRAAGRAPVLNALQM